MANSVYGLLQESIQKRGNSPAIRYKASGTWRELSWEQLGQKVNQVASKLIELGIEPGDRVVILSKTRLEWVLADLGIMAVGACAVPIYQSNIAKDAAYIYANSGAKLAIVEDDEQAAKIPKAQLLSIGDIFSNKINSSEIENRAGALKPSDIATIIYTSGTTGEAKGACLTHDNFLYEAQAIEKIGLISSDDIQLLFLPLAHVFARVMEIAWLKTAHVLCFAESIEKAVENMKEVKPTFMAAVPRIYEKVYARILAKARSGGTVKKWISNWALGLQQHPRGIRWEVAKRLIFSKIGKGLNETFGGELRFFISGGAPLNPEIAHFFDHAGVTILEGYGLTETTAATCVNLPGQNRIGTVGKPLPGMELKIAEDGEIWVRGRGVFQGYWDRPEQTAEVLSTDGWFKTGDIGVIESGGLLRITDRKKDLIVTAGGKKIAPQKLENLAKSKTSMISQVIVSGDQKNYLVALITLDEQGVKDFAKRQKVKGSYGQLTQNEAVKKKIATAIESLNKGLPSFEQLKKFKILDHDFVVGDQLTPTLKVKRTYCIQKYASEIESLYQPQSPA
ncbi:MAG: long-chain fatty acid--CoA ligase [Myxococcota bacterium]